MSCVCQCISGSTGLVDAYHVTTTSSLSLCSHTSCLIFYCTLSYKQMCCRCIAFWSITATVFPLMSNNENVFQKDYNGRTFELINPCGPKGGINHRKPRHEGPVAESSLDRTGSNYLRLNRTSRLLDYLLWRKRTPGQLSLLLPPP